MKNVSVRLRPEVLALLGLVVFQAYLVCASDGFYPIDEGAHFIADVSALQKPSISLGVWHRFGGVWLFALPARLGHGAVKVFASLLFLLTIFVSWKAAGTDGLPHREWLPVLLGLQPAFLDLSYTCLAELPSALLLILSYYLYRVRHWSLSLCAASLVFLFRYEMSFFAVLVSLAALRERRFGALPLALAGPLLWYAFSWVWTGDPTWLPRTFLRYGELPKYVEGTVWHHYLTRSVDIFGWVQVGLVVVLTGYMLRERRMQLAMPLLAVCWCVALNSLAANKDLNWTGSVGDFRYLTPVAPFVALLALAGLSRLQDSLQGIALSRVLPPCLALVAALATVSSVRPHHFTRFEDTIMALTRRAASDPEVVPILSNHWAARFAVLGENGTLAKVSKLTRESCLENPRAYILWDSQFAHSPFSQQKLTLAEVRADPAVRLVDSVEVEFGSVLLFLRDARGPGTGAPEGPARGARFASPPRIPPVPADSNRPFRPSPAPVGDFGRLQGNFSGASITSTIPGRC